MDGPDGGPGRGGRGRGRGRGGRCVKYVLFYVYFACTWWHCLQPNDDLSVTSVEATKMALLPASDHLVPIRRPTR